MDPRLETAAPPREHCAYCDAPLSITSAENPALKYCCYGCRLLGEAGQKPLELADPHVSPWFKIAVGALLAGQSMLLGLAANLTPPAGAVRWSLHLALIASSLGSMAVLGPPLFRSALETLRQRRISIELLFLAGIGGALGISIYSTVSGAGAIYYEVVSVLVTVYAIGKTLGAQSRARALAETRHLQQRFETCQKIISGDAAISVRVAQIRPGDQVRVLPGDPIPVDGVIVGGQAFVCETPLTGEPFPVVRHPGDEVFAGSYCEDGELRIRATVEGTARRLDALLSALESAREQPCHMQAQADAVVGWFLPLVFLTSAGTFLFWTWRGGWAAGWFNALAVLLIACPCAMGLATPIALWRGLAALASRGLVARGGDSIERLGSLDRMVFDKTGTLSQESFSLIDLSAMGSAPERQVILAQLRAIQKASSHPIARAFQSVDFEPAQPVFLCRLVKVIPALGVEAWLESAQAGDHHLRVGQRGLLSELAGETELLSHLKRTAGDHLVYVEIDGRLAAIAAVRERLRDSAEQAIRLLEGLGIECAVMTGDRAEHAARLLERAEVQGSLTPQDKAERIKALGKAGYQIGFVGDGVNDAPAMQAAACSVALAHGAGVTIATADAVLYGGDLRVLPWAVQLSRQVRGSVRSNLLFACAYNLIGMTLAAAGLLHPVAAALLMVISSFTVSWRALRSTEQAEGCCAAPLPVVNNPAAPAGPRARPRFQTVNGILVAAQAPFLIYLGHLSAAASACVIGALLGLGIFLARFRGRTAVMTAAMLGLGNWGMILGWWADAGFAPATLGCASCLAPGFSLGHVISAPWMNLGMLLFGLPGMWVTPGRAETGRNRAGGRRAVGAKGAVSHLTLALTAQRSPSRSVALGVLAAVGMLLGMHFGNYVLMRGLVPLVGQPFLLSYLGMTAGMLLGMTFACELGQALIRSFPFDAKTKH